MSGNQRERLIDMTGSISPLAPARVPDLPAIDGVKLATAAAGIKYPNRTDVLMVLLEPGTTAAGVLTRSKCPSAPVDWCRAKLKSGKARALIVNSGNANAFTGKSGRAATELTAKLAARAIGSRDGDILLASTGVIGEPLQASKFAGVMDELVHNARADVWLSAAKAIMTTDTFPKVATASAKLGKATVTINGIAKGAGMIAPDMATMLAFATGTAAARGAPRITRASDARLRAFSKAFHAVLASLSEQIARDGEGARKLVEVIVEGAVSMPSARKIARAIANSPLVKTAIAGEDANWGRVVMAVGKAGEPADRDKLSIWFNGIRVAHRGARDPGYDEAAVSAVMKKPEITLRVALGLGKGRDRMLTCDLTKEYVAINGDYRS